MKIKRKVYPCDQVYRSLVCKVNTRRGAPTGRTDIGTLNDSKGKKVYCRRIYLTIDGAYDMGGAYWGVGAPLYVEFTLDKTYVKYFRKD